MVSRFFDENYEFSFEQYNYANLQEKLQVIIDSDELESVSFELRNYILKYLDETKLQTNLEKIFKLSI